MTLMNPFRISCFVGADATVLKKVKEDHCFHSVEIDGIWLHSDSILEGSLDFSL